MTSPTKLPLARSIEIYRGDTWSALTLTYTDSFGTFIDVSNRSWSAQVKRTTSDETAVAAFSIDMTGSADGVVRFYMPAAVTAALTPGRYVWDVQETDQAGVVTTYLEGPVTVRGDVTR